MEVHLPEVPDYGHTIYEGKEKIEEEKKHRAMCVGTHDLWINRCVLYCRATTHCPNERDLKNFPNSKIDPR